LRKDGSQYVICEACAINNYGYVNGFSTLKAAEAHRRRLFDIQYLFCEMLTDAFMAQRGLKDINDLTGEQADALLLLTQELYNDLIPKSAKIRLEDIAEQDVIARYLAKKVKKAGVFLGMIP